MVNGVNHSPHGFSHRQALRYFAPRNFCARIEQAAEHHEHPVHDQFYEGANPSLESIRGEYEMTDLTTFLKHKFEPVVEDNLSPLPPLMQEFRSHMKKDQGTVKLVHSE